MDQKLYFYRAKVVSVYDGDTIRADIDLGLKTWVRNEKLRLARINTPELRGAEKEAGLAARDYLRGLVHDRDIIVETIRDRKGKYGRYIAEIWVKQASEFVNVNSLLLQEGHARPAG